MKSFAFILFYLTLYLSLFTFIYNDPCKYKLDKDSDAIETNSSTLKDFSDLNEKKQKCFSYSNSDVNTGLCCYNTSSTECTQNTTGNGVECPKNSTVYNNCGMAGIYQPLTSATCTEISLVQGYCCYAKFSDNSTACIRTKELNKNKNTATSQMEQYLKDVIKQNNNVNGLTISEVVCKGYNLKYYLASLIFAVIFL